MRVYQEKGGFEYINYYKVKIFYFFMKDLVYISSMGINDLVKKFPDKEDLIRFPNISAQYFGELIQKYFSFNGFYNITNVNEKKILLKKLDGNTLGPPKDYKIFELVFPEHTFALKSFAENGVSLVKGEIYSRKFEGTLKKVFGKEHSIFITKEIKE